MAAFLLPLLLFALFWVLLLRPQQRRMRQAQQMVASLEPGDEVVTAGGVFGTITDIDDDTLFVEVAPGVVLRVLRGAISQRLGPPHDEAADDDEEDEEAEPDDEAPGVEPRAVESSLGEDDS